ncbi:flippase-like domain-containing protein [Candidatus Woesearchaeota archaeon]|nr:flippase-like domain-containing protein [Candidatus Woesearchaeota archaeon]
MTSTIRTTYRWIFYLIGFILLFFIITQVDLQEVLAIFAQAKLHLIALGLLVSLVLVVFRALKWHWVLSIYGISLPFRKTFTYYIMGASLGMISPAKLGEFTKMIPLRKYALFPVFMSIFLDRLSDFLILLSIGLPGLFFVYDVIPEQALFIAIVLLMVVLFGILLLFQNIPLFLFKLAQKIYHKKLSTSSSVQSPSFNASLEKKAHLSLRNIFSLMLFSLFCWSLSFLATVFLARSLEINLPVLIILVVTAAYTIVDLLPISILGIGTRDSLVILLFGMYGISWELALAYSTLILASTIFVVIVPYSLLFFFSFFAKKHISHGDLE